eukprot:gene1256-biopygen483
MRTVATKLVNKVNDALARNEDNEEGIDPKVLKQYKMQLSEKKIDLKDCDREILDSMAEEADDDALDQEMEDASDYREKITQAIIAVDEILEGLKSPDLLHLSRPSRSSSQESLVSTIFSRSAPNERKIKVNLPKLELKKFEGKIYEWQEFWDGYASAIHENEQLASVDKFKYLKSLLEEPARGVIKGIPITEANYELAVTLLEKRYAKPSIIQREHINQMINIQPVFSERNVTKLRLLYDKVETHFRGLEAQEVDQTSYSSIVVPVILDKIPENVRYNMIRSSSSDHLEWNMKEMLTALERELVIRESHTSPFKSSTSSTSQGTGSQQEKGWLRPKREQGFEGTANALLATKNFKKKCVFCLEEDHASEDCQKVKDISERKSILKKFARCFNCLNSGHRSFQCHTKTSCKSCKGKHHAAICFKLNPKPISAPASGEESETPLNPAANAWVGCTGSGERVALQTALASVNGNRESRVRVLFDSGSHKSFIWAKAVDRLGLRLTRRERLSVRAFGSSETDVKMRDVVKIALAPLGQWKSVNVECFVVDDISCIANEHLEVVKKDFSHLNKLWFSDVSRNEEVLTVDVLIGADELWSFQDGEIKRGGPYEPVAELCMSKLSWDDTVPREKAAIWDSWIEDLSQTGIGQIVDIDRYSTLNRLLRITAWVKRAVANLKGKRNKGEVKYGNLSASEIKEAEKLWIRDVQVLLKADKDFEKTAKGTPSIINSDNAKTFKSIASFLKKMGTDEGVTGSLGYRGIEWKFNLAVSPWQGGHFERMVRSVKRCLRKVLGNARVNLDELTTVLTEVENNLNSCPLTFEYDELEEQVLTPSHLLVGRRLSSLSEGIELKSNINDADINNSLNKRFLYLSRKLDHFWNRWRKEYLIDLREAHRVPNKGPAVISEGEVVLVHEEKVKRGMWKMAVVEKLIFGKDNQVRGATIRRVGKGKGKPEIIDRPIQRLFPLECAKYTGGRHECMNGDNGDARKNGDEGESQKVVDVGGKAAANDAHGGAGHAEQQRKTRAQRHASCLIQNESRRGECAKFT